MKIAVISHIRHAIAEPFAGGMEAHSHQLVRGLRRRGHDVTLFTAGGSDILGAIAVCDRPYEAVLPWHEWRGTAELAAYQHRAFARAWDTIKGESFDIVHNNSLFPPLIDWARADSIPMLTSQHVPPFGIMRDAVDAARYANWVRFTVTSHHQAGLWAAESRNRSDIAVVHNGIDTSEWPVSPKRSDRLVWFGRITPNKGLREAVCAAHCAGVSLDIIGVIEDRDYFADYVEPWLSEAIRYLGHLSGNALHEAVSKALAAVVTPMWDEPFGLVAAEAMSCGVPVIAFDRGALSEVLGDCGRLVPAGNVDALAEAMRDAQMLDGMRCRSRIEAQFSIDRMLAGYEDQYHLCGAAARRGQAGDNSPMADASSSSRTAALLA